METRCGRVASLLVGAATALAVCGAPAVTSASRGVPAAMGDTGVSLAENSGPTLIVVSLDPAEPGTNTLQVDVRDPSGALISGAVRVDVSLDGAPVASTTLPAAARRGSLAIAHAGRIDARVTVVEGKSAGASVAFTLGLPAARVEAAALAEIDRAMQALHTLREAQTLTGGGATLVFHFEYLAPDRVRYTTLSATGQLTETRLIGRDRFDRDAGGPWSHTDLGFPSRVPYSAYAHAATRLRLIGQERDGDQDVLEFAFVQAPDTYYRVWAGARDHLVRRYVMMATGHYMTGAYSDYDATLAIAAP